MDDTQTSRDEEFSPGCSSVDQKRSEAESSCVSLRSDQSMGPPQNFKRGYTQTDLSSVPQKRSKSSCVSVRSDTSMNQSLDYKSEETKTDPSHEVLKTFRSNLLKKFERLYEGTATQRNPTLLNEIYTELYITESESGEISNEHEVRQIETQSRRAATEDTAIKCSDIFRPLPGQDKAIRTVLTKGVAGIGKTVSVQKFILDWAEGKENQDVQLIFPLPFREINLMKDKTLSLSDLLHVFFPETKEMEISSDEYKVLFIFDGLDECRLSLNFKSKVKLCNISESASVDVLLMNLIVGNLLPSALIWITSRPAAADLVPSECVHLYEEDLSECGIDVTEASVYSGLCTQIFREELGLYQGKVFCFVHLSVQEHLAALYVHLSCTNHNRNVFEPITKQNLRSKLKDLFQHVSLSELHQRALKEGLQSKNGHLDLFLRFLLGLSVKSHQILLQKLMKQTRSSSDSNEKTVEYIKIRIRFINSPEQSINLFHCLNELGDHSLVQEIQQYLKSGKIKEAKLSSSQWSAVGFVLLTSENKLDTFDINEFVGENNKAEKLNVLQYLLPVIKVHLSDCGVTDKDCAALTSVLRSNPSKLRNLDLNNKAIRDSGVKLLSVVLEDPRCKLETLWLRDCGVTDEGCAVLSSALRSNPSHLRDLYLSLNKLEDPGVTLLSAVLEDPHCKLEKLWLWDCGVTDEGCAALSSALRSNPSHLRELSLTENKLKDPGVTLLSAVLEDPHCKLEKLWLSKCGITDEGCAALSSALRSNPSHLRELSLSGNNLEDPGVTLLSAVLEDPHCKLEKLWLYNCGVTDEGCAALSSALRSNPSHLRDLDLTLNNLEDPGVTLLSAVLEDPRCKLEKLRLSKCGITDEGCAALSSALRSNPSHLRELYLSVNNLEDPGVMLLSAVLEDPHCKLEKLWLSDCGVTDEGCAALSLALRSNPSHLRDLNLTENKLGDSGVTLLSAVLEDPHCKLETLR
uniref:NACHT domain-containing protein n=1 Tax=Cyprinus carpio TaxID=7962 RepID=A0A8C2DLH6_CYPCA